MKIKVKITHRKLFKMSKILQTTSKKSIDTVKENLATQIIHDVFGSEMAQISFIG